MMDENRCVQLLEEHGVKPTANRIVVVKALAAAGRPMSLSELEYKILTIDKSGVFRCLTLFKEHRLVHVIEDGGDGVRYELCHSHDSETDEDLHVHFFCERCRRTYCLENIAIPEVALPEGFEQCSVNFMVKGICPECKGKSEQCKIIDNNKNAAAFPIKLEVRQQILCFTITYSLIDGRRHCHPRWEPFLPRSR